MGREEGRSRKQEVGGKEERGAGGERRERQGGAEEMRRRKSRGWRKAEGIMRGRRRRMGKS